MDLNEEIRWEVKIRLNRPDDRQQFNASIDGKWEFEVGCKNNWNVWEAYNKANKWLLNQFDWPNFQILSVYCPESNRGWKNFKIDCESYSK